MNAKEVLKYCWNITLKALFLSLFIRENCFNLILTVLSKETLGSLFAFCNHKWSTIRNVIIFNFVKFSEQEIL